MKRLLAAALALALLLLPMAALAAPSDKMFLSAKQALNLISYGEYQKAIDKLKVSSGEPTAEDFEQFIADNLDSVFYGSVQNTVAVAYKKGSGWKLAVPVEEPDSGAVQALVLKSKNGKSFDGYTAMTWSDVRMEVDESGSVTWNEAYEPGTLVIVADDY